MRQRGSDVNTLSDEDGKFSINVPDVTSNRVELVFESFTSAQKVVHVMDYSELHVTFDILEGVELLGMAVYSKPTFWQRITRPFKKLF